MAENRINILNDDIIGKIAAGEVVERPASAVKELVENSIDAQADSIEIEIQAAGQSLIRIADNGVGMSGEDARIASKRHATSKINGIEDLDSIVTLGFRGEALSSIAAVSQMDIITCPRSETSGIYLYMEGGEILKVRPVGRSHGTTIEVRNLFYNVPARRKFLKKEASELAEIINVIGRFVVAYPGIEFKLSHSDRVLFHAPKEMKLIERIRLILGPDVANHMVRIPESESDDICKIDGFVSIPSNTRKDRRSQMFFVNRRFVRNRLLSDSIYDAYRSLLERGRFPGAVLFISISPGEVDVNVHPMKLEVKFSDERTIRDAVKKAVQSAFENIKKTGDAINTVQGSLVQDTGFIEEEKPVLLGISETQEEFAYEFNRTQDKPVGSGAKLQVSIDKEQPELSFSGQMHQVGGCYIVQIKEDTITIIDQHAAHERILYEFFSRGIETGAVEVQNLLFPVRMDLSAAEAVIMDKITSNFRILGFHIELFGDKSFIVQAAPAVLKDRDLKTVVYDVLASLTDYDKTRIEKIDELIKVTSCRAAIKAGDVLSNEEMIALIRQLNKCSLPFTCPHGRPTVQDITIDDLEKMFRRK
ncbi:MAG: DNA mismatch repair endonuclease MutL [Candidatus Omnitrophota bacterium]